MSDEKFTLETLSCKHARVYVYDMLANVVDTDGFLHEHTLALVHISKCPNVVCMDLFEEVHGHSRNDPSIVLYEDGKIVKEICL